MAAVGSINFFFQRLHRTEDMRVTLLLLGLFLAATITPLASAGHLSFNGTDFVEVDDDGSVIGLPGPEMEFGDAEQVAEDDDDEEEEEQQAQDEGAEAQEAGDRFYTSLDIYLQYTVCIHSKTFMVCTVL